MEVKKNQQHDVHRHSFRNFLIGLVVSVSLAIFSFEWTTKKINHPIFVESEEPSASMMTLLMPIQWEPIPAKLIVRKPKPDNNSIKLIETYEEESAEKPIELNQFDNAPQLNNEISLPTEFYPEDTTSIFVFAETFPHPLGGYEEFYKQLSKSLKYPTRAARNEVQGKVFIEFVVDRTGKVTQLKVLKGIGAGCDEEAMRVLALSKWEPGKQRGRAANVRMVMPILFTLDKHEQ